MHWAVVRTRLPGWPEHTVVHADAAPGRLHCELVVLRCGRVRLGGAAAAAGWPETEAWESVIELRTGRTHQVPLHWRGC